MVTVFVAVLTQPVTVTLYVIKEVPPAMPVITPVEASMVAAVVVLLLQLPPAVVLIQHAVLPWHTGVVPVIV